MDPIRNTGSLIKFKIIKSLKQKSNTLITDKYSQQNRIENVLNNYFTQIKQIIFPISKQYKLMSIN